MSAGTRRWKYLSDVLLNSLCPVMQNIGICARSLTGATVATSSDVQPTTAIRLLEWLAVIAFAPREASASSPRASYHPPIALPPPPPPSEVIAGVAVEQ